MATPVQDIQPRALAELLRRMGDTVAEQDREITAILRECQQRLEALAWTRYATYHSRRCDQRRFIKRHRALLGIRAR